MCTICFDDSPRGLVCEAQTGHFICSECAPQEVQRVLQEIKDSEVTLERHRAQGGRIKCVHPKCSVLYSEPALAHALPDDAFRRYRAAQDSVVEQRLFTQLQQRFQEQLAIAMVDFENRNRIARTARDEAATTEFLKRQYPNAVQCPSCSAGPVIPENCYDLGAHHGECTRGGHISSACPACGFFHRERGNWVRWNGQMRQ